MEAIVAWKPQTGKEREGARPGYICLCVIKRGTDWIAPAARLNSLRKKYFLCHPERSEGSFRNIFKEKADSSLSAVADSSE
jgi:hypothetical protein